MKASKKGFTIIEVSLVLAITGLLTVSVLVGIQYAITNQRYNDSVSSFKAFLQDQYNEVSTPDIAIDSRNPKCPTDARGRSNCIVLGRMIEIDTKNGATNIKIKKILGNSNVLSDTRLKTTTDINAFSTPGFLIEAESLGEYKLEWDADLRTNHTAGNGLFLSKIIILRSPITGSMSTFSTNNLSTKLVDIFKQNQKTLEMCVFPIGIKFGTKRAVVLKPYGADASAVEIAPTEEVINGVQPVKC